MKSRIITFLSISLITSMLGCGRDNPTHTDVGIVYKSDGIGGEALKITPDYQKPNIQQVNNRLKLMGNNDRFQFALDCGNQGKYAEALAAYNMILETDRNYPDLYYYQGLLYRDMGTLDEAIGAFQTAINQNPNSAEAHYNLGYAYRYKGLHNEAIGEYRKSLELIPEDKTKQLAYVHYNLGFSCFSSGMIDDAISEFNKALAYRPKDKEIHQKLGIAYTAKGWTDKAKDEFLLYNECEKKPAKKIP